MIAVTGMHRSGTSCVTGLLERCGFSLGSSHPLFNEPRYDNAKGHFENIGAMAINENVLRYAQGSWMELPSPSAIKQAGDRLAMHFLKFATTFDGRIFKDPRISVTMDLWRRHCPSLEKVVLCLRNPVAVAVSLNRRDGIPLEKGLMLWYEYNMRFVRDAGSIPVVFVDYDNLRDNLEFELSNILMDLGSPLTILEMRERTEGFYTRELNHDPSSERHIDMLPDEIRKLYDLLKKQTFALRQEPASVL